MNALLINQLNEFFKEQPVEKVWVFGSFAREQETNDSDIDLLVRFKKGAKITLFIYASIVNKLEALLNRKVDLVEENQLKDFAKESADKEKRVIYERKA